jgi:hypothetical protein
MIDDGLPRASVACIAERLPDERALRRREGNLHAINSERRRRRCRSGRARERRERGGNHSTASDDP